MSPTRSLLSRRQALAATVLAPLAWSGPSLAQDAPLRLGQTTSLTGPLADIGQALVQGAQLCFDSVNAAGGVDGRRVELVSKDDAYDPKRGLANIEGFLADGSILALFNCLGTPITEAALPRLVGSGMLYFAPLSGAQLARPKERNFFNIRASYAEEAERLVTHLATIGVKRVGFVWQNNAFGKEAFAAAKAAAARHQFTATADASLDNTATEVEAQGAVTKLLASEPEAVLILLAGKPSVPFVKTLRKAHRWLPLYALSVLGASDVLRHIGEDGLGMKISQVVPLPNSLALGVVRELNTLWKRANLAGEPSHMTLEGFINAKVMVEALRRAGRAPTRAAMVDAVWKLK